MVERGLTFAAGGAAAGGVIGLLTAGYGKPVVVESGIAYAGKNAATHAAGLAAVAGIFAASDTFLTQVRGHSPANAVAAGCLAGAALGAQQGSIARMAVGCGLFGAVQAFGARSLSAPACASVKPRRP